MKTDIVIRPVRLDDAEELTHIYNYYIANTTITFEITPITVDEMRRRIIEITAQHPYYVCEQVGKVVGYCYVHPWHTRAAFLHTVELSVYLDFEVRHQGIGRSLVEYVIAVCRQRDYHVLIASITSENTASFHFHETLGFRHVAHYDEVGFKFDRWVGLDNFQLML